MLTVSAMEMRSVQCAHKLSVAYYLPRHVAVMSLLFPLLMTNHVLTFAVNHMTSCLLPRMRNEYLPYTSGRRTSQDV